MDFKPYERADLSVIENLYVSVFTESDGEAEGALIGKLARELILSTDDRDLEGFVAVDKDRIIGSIFFSRLTFEMDIEVFLLAPVAIHSKYQGRGIGQGLINYGLIEMKRKGVAIVTTYGDPDFYSRVGFYAVPPDVIAPPIKLSQPEGWLGQSLTKDPIAPIRGRPSCVKALNDPVYW